MAPYALFMKCIFPGVWVIILIICVALTAVVGVIIFNVMMAVQTIKAVIVCVHGMGENNLSTSVLKQ